MLLDSDNVPTLPSSETAYLVWQGQPRAAVLVARDLVWRTLLITIGMLIFGFRRRVVEYAFAGALAIEFAVITREGIRQLRRRKQLEAARVRATMTAPAAGALGSPIENCFASKADHANALDAFQRQWIGKMGIVVIGDELIVTPVDAAGRRRRLMRIAVGVDGDVDAARAALPADLLGAAIVVRPARIELQSAAA